ncbi:MAG: potassium transporter Kup [Rhodocyclaceae bacterium]|nr:potassium transporter Kup [Rhodocyclaceae bacterium]MCA3073654.1 potassium transporter Kup [Rhodocyclaceae bacterium]MCA3088989.1 potassium transporter Kup [Rhodocyclaceae bacterium]MCA3095725.1 potassium transporter Kup [Rhodocyclaceae bacterium]MCA3097732.1 potassium transporter Kup [Rhodocyclaceae bacterium]
MTTTASTTHSAPAPDTPSRAARQGLGALTLGAIGVVYGDIGTSPLYTMKEVFAPHTGVPLDAHNLVGAVSVIFWALMLVVTLKYVILILRADNHGEGGGLALTAMAAQAVKDQPALRHALLLLGVFGATLFYGDSLITPAISVLGAMEGLELVTPALKPYVVPITVAILVGLFLVQRFGTAFVGRYFGPIIVLWFVMLGVMGVVHIVQQPAILAALNPLHAWNFLAERGWHLFAAVGAIVLALTGAEALYADMGHFGRKPIQLAWTGLVLPGLALNYLGQGALLMGNPAAIENPFYRLFPDALLLPALVLATLAAIIASQAVISGAYSMTKQAIQLGFLPRMTIRYTSAREMGQIYMPAVNWALLAGVIAAVLFFGSSSALAGAYGIAVTLTMMITTMLTYFVVRKAWQLPAPVAIGATAFFLAIDALLVAGCAVKFFDGGWFPLALGLLLFGVMSTWSRGRARLVQAIRRDGLELQSFIDGLDPRALNRAERTAVYAVADPTTVPQALLHNLKHNQVLHVRNVILTVVFHEVPWIPMDRRVQVAPLGHGFWRVTLNFGFMNTPDVPAALELTQSHGLHIPVFETSYFLSREAVVPTSGGGMANWRERLFAAMTRNAGGVVEFFRLPSNAVVELGTRVQI